MLHWNFSKYIFDWFYPQPVLRLIPLDHHTSLSSLVYYLYFSTVLNNGDDSYWVEKSVSMSTKLIKTKHDSDQITNEKLKEKKNKKWQKIKIAWHISLGGKCQVNVKMTSDICLSQL